MLRKNLLITALGLACFAESAYALPFKPDPVSFANWLSAQSWRDGNKRKFIQLSTCAPPLYKDPMNPQDTYQCVSGYMTVQTPFGLQRCQIGRTYYTRWPNQKIQYGVEDVACRDN